MKRLLVAIVLALVSTAAFGQAAPSVSLDPCFGNTAKSSVPVNITTATTTQLIAAVAGKTIYVCNGFLDVGPSATTAATVQFEYGTGGTCGTGTTVLTGTMGTGTATAGTTGEAIPIAPGGTAFQTASGTALCAVSVGTTVVIEGYLTYIQQ